MFEKLINQALADNAVRTTKNGAQARGIHGGNGADHENSCAPRKRAEKVTKAERKLASRVHAWDKEPNRNRPSLTLHKPGSLNFANR